ATQYDWTHLQLGGASIDVSTSDGYLQNRQNSPPTPVKSDPLIRFVNSTNTDVWSSGKTVIYDSNNDNLYDSGDTVIAGATPATGTKLKSDPLIRFVNSTNTDVWSSGKTVLYDSDNNNLHDSGEPVISGTEPPTTKLGPIASFTFSPAKPQKGQNMIFDASASFDPDSRLSTAITRWLWDFGDGIVVSSQSSIQTHSFGSQGSLYTGNFSVLLRVFDSDNNFTGAVAHLVGIIPPPWHEVIVSSVGVSPTLAEAGAKLNVTVIVQNSLK